MSALPIEPTGVITTDDQGFEDYFGFGGGSKWYFPDRKQYISFSKMNEGQRKKFQQATNRDVRFNRRTDDAILRGDPAADRHALILAAVTGWYLLRRNPQTQQVEEIVFSPTDLQNWLNVANPQFVDDLEKAIRKANPWLMDEATVADIDKQIIELQEMKADLQKREAGN